ncbi:MAG: CRISPR system precrRNA processing endoribonuclease RAMP protein Cas6 [Candidatus Anstonellales archaeon]
MEIKIATAIFEAITPVRIPKLATLMLRGVVGEKLKLLTCRYRTNILSGKCHLCSYIKTCPYGYLYEQGQDPIRINSALTPPPRPYVFEPLEKEDYMPGEELKVNIKIATKYNWADKFIEHAFSSIDELGKDKNRGFGKIKFKDIKWDKKEVKPLESLQDRVRVEFKTPTALYREKALLLSPSLYDILIFSARRFFLIYSTYYDKNYKYKFHNLVKVKDKAYVHATKTKAEQIERWSNRRKMRENITGILGSITYSLNKIDDKDLRKDIRFLLGFANEMNVGKRACAGLGKVKITSYSA